MAKTQRKMKKLAKLRKRFQPTAAKPKKRIRDEELVEILRLEHARKKPHPIQNEVCGVSERKRKKRRFGEPTKIEYRTGSGTRVREIKPGEGFGETPGVIRQSAGCCNPAIHRCMDGFYGQIDRDLDEWQFREDLKLRVPYAVKAWRHHKRHMSVLRKDAKRRGVI